VSFTGLVVHNVWPSTVQTVSAAIAVVPRDGALTTRRIAPVPDHRVAEEQAGVP
jgi:hypothetical protein